MDAITQAVKILRTGGVVAYPTDTAYGLAVDATNPKAVDKLYRLKGRDFKKPTHIIFPNTNWLKKIVKLNKPSSLLMNKFMPGPLTIVLPLKAKGQSWRKLSAGTNTLGIRYPHHPLCEALVSAFKKPITTSSANISGKSNCYSVQEVKKQFSKNNLKPDFYIDGGNLSKTKPSTVVSLVEGTTILRPGPITEKEIKRALK